MSQEWISGYSSGWENLNEVFRDFKDTVYPFFESDTLFLE